MHLELVAVPGLRALTARRLTGGNRKDLGGEADRALDAELLVLRAVDEVARDCSASRSVNLLLPTERAVYAHFSRLRTLLDVSVILILWILAAGTGPAESYSFSLAT